jgi:hypothetical protein
VRVPAASTDATFDGCRQTGGQRPDTTIRIGTDAADAWRKATARGVTYSCAIHPTLELHLAVAGDTAPPSIDSVVVSLDGTGSALQVLHREPGEAETPLPHHTDLLRAVDLDADGYRDLLLGKFWGATGNRGYDVWRFDASTRRFVADSALSEMWDPAPVPGRPCVRTHSHSSARDDGNGLYCLYAGRWRLDSAEINHWNRDSSTVTREILARRGDSLVVVERTTRPDSL